MPTSRPLVTTVIPTYRRPQLLRRAVMSALNQSRPDGKVAVYDDASGDETEHVVRQLAAHHDRVTYHRHDTNLGLVGNFRYALEQVETPFFSILSNDDMLLPRMYEAGLAALESHPEAAFVATQVVHVDDELRVIRLRYPWHPGLYVPPDGLLRLIEWGAPAWTGIIFRSSLLAEFGNLDPETGTLMDYDFQIRIAAHRQYVVDPTPGAVFFHRATSISGESRLAGTWPGWPRMMEKLERDQAVPVEIREEARAMLTQQLISRIRGIGIVSSRQGNFADARGAADLLADTFGEHSKARLVRLLATSFERVPPLARIHARLSEWRQPFQRTGWRRSPLTIDRYVDDQTRSAVVGSLAVGSASLND